MVHEQTLMRHDLAELRDANDRLSRRRRTKKKQLQKGGSLTIGQAEDLKSQLDETVQLVAETT